MRANPARNDLRQRDRSHQPQRTDQRQYDLFGHEGEVDQVAQVTPPRRKHQQHGGTRLRHKPGPAINGSSHMVLTDAHGRVVEAAKAQAGIRFVRGSNTAEACVVTRSSSTPSARYHAAQQQTAQVDARLQHLDQEECVLVARAGQTGEDDEDVG